MNASMRVPLDVLVELHPTVSGWHWVCNLNCGATGTEARNALARDAAITHLTNHHESYGWEQGLGE